MKKVLFLLAALFMFAACYDDSELRSRLEALEQAGYQAQLDALKSSVIAIEAVDAEIKNTIATLQNLDKDMQKQIDSLKEFDKVLEAGISDLQILIEQEATETKDWVEKTFATLEQYNSIVAELTTLNDLLLSEVADLDSTISANYKALSEEIANSKSAIEDWVETTLETYCTDEELDEKLSGLKTDLESLQAELETLEARVDKLEQVLGSLLKDFTITFSDYEIGILAGKSTSVEYLIKGATNKTEVKAFGQGGWYAKVTPATNSTGTITVTAPDPLTEDEIIVLVNDGEYRSIMTSINFVTGVFSSVISAQEVPIDGGNINIEVNTNMQYDVVIPDNAKSWLSIVETKALREETITLSCAKNDGLQRTATIKILNEDGNEYSSYAIFQWGISADVTDMSTDGTANSYIVSNVGYYKFKTTKGNSAESVGIVASAEVLWETFGTATAPNVGDLISDISYANDYISFRTGTTYKEGNALIAAKDVDGNILWSWHIWFTDKPKDQVYNNNVGTMMDRNLGATSATKGDVGALGLLYQWGRKDPFLGSSSISSNTQAASTLASWSTPVSSDVSKGTIAYATANPTTFITYNSRNNDWLYTGTDETDNTRWHSSKGIYDPCPVGYRVPDGGISGIWQTAFGGNYYPNWDDTNYGYDFGGTDAGTNYLTSEECWYAAAGCLMCGDGGLSNVGFNDYYWSCTPHEYYCHAYSLYFDSDGNVNPSNNSFRASGLSVRCQKEE